jgi:acylglycerol lipase
MADPVLNLSASASAEDGFIPPPVIRRSTILAIGFGVFFLALIWPPLILMVTYLLSILVPYSWRVNDDPTSRRRLFKEFRERDDLPAAYRLTDGEVVIDERYWVNERGMCLQTATLVPKNQEIKAVLCFCHGYTDNASFVKQIEYCRFVRHGIAVVTIEYEGHGRSDGELGLVYDWDRLVDDTSSLFKEVSEKKFPGKKVFLMGESMGGAAAFSTYQRNPSLFSGVVFVSPMCKISEDMLPPKWVIDLLYLILGPSGTCSLLGRLPIAPSKGDLREFSFRLKWKRNIVTKSPTCFVRNPRLATARELLDVTAHISSSLKSFDAPFLVQHGKEDRVTDPKLSQALYDESMSHDKTIKLYDGLWHAITSGEEDEDIDLVFNDAIQWVLQRV